MVCYIFGTKLSPEPMPTYYQLDSLEDFLYQNTKKILKWRHLKMLSTKYWAFCWGINVLKLKCSVFWIWGNLGMLWSTVLFVMGQSVRTDIAMLMAFVHGCGIFSVSMISNHLDQMMPFKISEEISQQSQKSHSTLIANYLIKEYRCNVFLYDFQQLLILNECWGIVQHAKK